MTHSEDLGGAFDELAVRVARLRAARTSPAADHTVLLDAALAELRQAVEMLGNVLGQGAARPRTSSAEGSELRLFKNIFEHLPVPAALVDGDTAVRRVNRATTDLTGVPAAYAAGRRLGSLFRPADQVVLDGSVAAVARGEGARSLTVGLRQRPGPLLSVALAVLDDVGAPAGSGSPVVVVLRPVAGPEPLPAAPDRPGGAERPVAMSGAVGPPELMDLLDDTTSVLLRAVTHGSPIPSAAVTGLLHERLADWALLDLPEADSLRRVAVCAPHDAADPTLEKAFARQDPYRCPVVAQAAATGDAVLLVWPEDPGCLGEDDGGAPLCARGDVSSLLAVPLRASSGGEGEEGGVLTLLRTGPRPCFSLAEAAVVERVARHLSAAAAVSAGDSRAGADGRPGPWV